jgi:succinoglycan biosynthesis transport protein ExoP
MTTLPANASPVIAPPLQPRPAAPSAAMLSVQAGSIDPLKLLNKHKWLLTGSAVVGAVMGVGAHFVLRSVAPEYRPIALFNCLPPQESADGRGAAGVSPQEMDRFMQTQVRVMTSDTVINKVAEDQQLQSKAPDWVKHHMIVDRATGLPRPDYAAMAKELKDIVSARVIPQTNLIELSVRDRRAVDATEILALVRQKYSTVLYDQGNSLSGSQVESLRQAITRIDEEVAVLARRRESLIQLKGLDSLSEHTSATKAELAQTNEQIQEIQTTLQAAIKQREQMREARAAGVFSPELLSDIEKDPAVLDVQSMISRLETNRQMLLTSGHGPEHRAVRMVEANLDGANQNLQRVKAERLAKMADGQFDKIAKGVEQLQAQETDLLEKQKDLRIRLNDLTRTQATLSDIDNQINGQLANKTKNAADLQNLLSLQNTPTYNRVVELQRERTPTEMSFPRLKMMIPAGVLICVGLVGGIVLLREVVDQRIKGPSDIGIIPRTKLLGWVPDAAEDPSGQGATETAFRDRPRGIVAESFRQIRGSMSKRIQQADHRTILVLAGMPGSGATSAVTNLAFAFAAADKRVIVVDANFRRPALHRVMGLTDGPGLADVLTRTAELSDVVQATSTPNLDLLSAGSREHRVYERLATETMGEVLAKLRGMYDLVLIDCAPAIVAGDGIALAHRCDASVLIVRALAEKRGMIARVKTELSDGRGEFLGVVVNAVRSASGGYMKGNIRAAHEYQQA